MSGERRIGPHQLLVLSAFGMGAVRVVGGIVVTCDDAEVGGTVSIDVLRGIARALWECGDTPAANSPARALPF
jgi:hypothetical protein